MDTEVYKNEALRQLNDETVYKKLDTNPLVEINKKVNSFVKDMFRDGHIDESTYKFLLSENDTVRTAPFYLLPKVHKPGVPGRPVVSGCSTPTDKLSKFVDYYLQPLMKHIPSHTMDTSDFLRTIGNYGKVPDNAIFVCLDVVALYPSIPIDDGLEALRAFLDLINYNTIDPGTLCKATELVLKSNILSFGNDIYLQKSGTAIGTKLAPSFANIFMHMLETKFLDSEPCKPALWKRLIDDIFAIWLHGETALFQFIERFNSFHPSIKVTVRWSYSRVEHLDVDVSKSTNGDIVTDLYCKPTDAHLYLDYSSCHPHSCKNSLPYSQALRIRRICSTDELFEKRCAQLKGHFINRGYPASEVAFQINRARVRDRGELLKRKVCTRDARTAFVIDYHPTTRDVGKFVHRNFEDIIHKSDRLKECIGKPVIAFRRPKNLKDMLVHSKICVQTDSNLQNGMNRCNNRRCEICDLVLTGNRFSSGVTGDSFYINKHFDCNSKNVVYLISCEVCAMQYVGTTNNFRLRVNNHRSRLRKIKANDDILYKHFHSEGHSPDHFKIQIIDSNDPKDPTRREGFWQYRLQSLTPLGLNTNDMFFSQNKASRKRH
jgi:hypothetical protein